MSLTQMEGRRLEVTAVPLANQSLQWTWLVFYSSCVFFFVLQFRTQINSLPSYNLVLAARLLELLTGFVLMWPSQLSFSTLVTRQGSKLVRVASCVSLALIHSLAVHPVTLPQIPVGKPRRFSTIYLWPQEKHFGLGFKGAERLWRLWSFEPVIIHNQHNGETL